MQPFLEFMKTDEHYDAVARELLEGRIKDGVWARALAESNGNNEQAKAIYIRHRVAQLLEEEKARREVARPQGSKAHSGTSRAIRFMFVLVGLVVSLAIIGTLVYVFFGGDK